jgi:2-polyprenyl-3-methyl-5-hydroxy-6-metoxy-1,4-benzoquinol methylase
LTDDYAPHELEWSPARVSRIWDFYASTPAYRTAFFSAHSGAAIVKRADALIGLEGKSVLDFGCGRGDLIEPLLACGGRVTGLEFSPDAAEESRARFQGHERFQGVVVAEDLPSELTETFDVVFLIEVLEHLLPEQVAGTLAEVHRLTKPGGSVVVTTPNAEVLGEASVHCPECGATFHRWQHQRTLDSSSISALFAEHGFRTKHVEALYWGLSRLGALRQRLKRNGPLPRPHLFYVGEPVASVSR